MGTIAITQYLRPNGEPREVTADVPDEYAAKAEGMQFSAEVLIAGQVVVYARRVGQPEEDELSELAENGPGDRTPTAMLCKLIDRLATVEHKQGLECPLCGRPISPEDADPHGADVHKQCADREQMLSDQEVAGGN